MLRILHKTILPALLKAAAWTLSLSLCTALAGCAPGAGPASSSASSSPNTSSPSSSSSSAPDHSSAAAGYSQEDLDSSWDSSAVSVLLGGTSDEGGAGVDISGSTVTISQAGTYLLSGSLADGQIVVDAGKDDLVRLVLNGVDAACSSSAPLFVKQAEKVVLILAQGSENSFSDGSDYVFEDGEDEPNAAIFSKDDLTVTGSGSLTVSGNYNSGITSKDSLVITGGTLQVTAVNHGIRGKDSVSILDGVFAIESGNDGIKSNNDTDADAGWVRVDGGSFTIVSGGDAIQAETDLTVTGGEFTVTSGGGADNAAPHTFAGNMGGKGMGDPPARPNRTAPGEADAAATATPIAPSGATDAKVAPEETAAETDSSAADDAAIDSFKGLKAGSSLSISGGNFILDCADDAVHANGNADISGGVFTIDTGDDGFHSGETLSISGGEIEIVRSYEGLEGSSVDLSGGSVALVSSDDGINAAGGNDASQAAGPFGGDQFGGGSHEIRIRGGFISVDASGDGVDSNGSIYQTGGTLLVSGPTNSGNGAFDYDSVCEISGGVAAVSGSSGMAQSPSSTSSQASLTVVYSSVQPGGTLASLTDSQGNLILAFAPVKDYQSLVITAPSLAQGESYSLFAGGSCSGNGFSGLYEEGEISGASQLCTVTLTDLSTRISDSGAAVSGGMGGMGGMGGGRGGRGSAPVFAAQSAV
ncbi:MAG: carbohydrate-binding domain-containing protein [Oscillospiraceae bacterium]|nr:carbohydrate-binding domain-containing protein [Oscillospiraceae bacterium]